MILEFLKRLWHGQRAIKSISHPQFGELSLFKFGDKFVWMNEVFESDPKEKLVISVETKNGEEPTAIQIAFFSRLTSSQDQAFNIVAEHLAPKHKEYLGQSIPSQWQNAFRFSGISVPVDGNESNPWDLTFECLTNNSMFLFTCYFEQGACVHVGVDT